MYGRASRWDKADPISESLSFSSFSTHVDDYWGSDLERFFKIVVMPGYEIPDALDLESKDSMWVSGKVDRPMVVWDGYSAPVLFEIIRECFDPDGTSEFIRVYDARKKIYLTDPRDDAVLKLRPRRWKGMTPAEIHRHVLDLWCWAELVPSHQDQDVASAFYGLLVPGLDAIGRDMHIRKAYAQEIIPEKRPAGYDLVAKTRQKVRKIPYLKRGPLPSKEVIEGSYRDLPAIPVGFSSQYEFEKLVMADVQGQYLGHGDFYKLSARKWIAKNKSQAEWRGIVVPGEGPSAPAQDPLMPEERTRDESPSLLDRLLERRASGGASHEHARHAGVARTPSS